MLMELVLSPTVVLDNRFVWKNPYPVAIHAFLPSKLDGSYIVLVMNYTKIGYCDQILEKYMMTFVL